MAEETAVVDGEGADALDTSIDTGAPDADVGAATQPEAGGVAAPKAGEPADKTGPKSMLESIQQGLKPDAAAAPGEPGNKPDKAAATPKPGEKPAPTDPKLGEDRSPRGDKRFSELTASHKKLETEHAELKQRYETETKAHQEFKSLLSEAKVTSAALGDFLDMSAAVAKGDYRRALQVLDHYRAEISKVAGISTPGVDLLSDFPDLRADVDNMRLTEARAVEIATQRRNEHRRKSEQEQVERTRQTQEATVGARKKAADDIAAWALEVGRTDIDFPVKEKVMLDEADAIMRDFPPDQWLREVQRIYRLIRVPAGGGSQGGRTPLRSGAGGGAPTPTSLLEAVTQGLKPRG